VLSETPASLAIRASVIRCPSMMYPLCAVSFPTVHTHRKVDLKNIGKVLLCAHPDSDTG
jgi:hypothetical protein